MKRRCKHYCNAMRLGAAGPLCPHCDECERALRLFERVNSTRVDVMTDDGDDYVPPARVRAMMRESLNRARKFVQRLRGDAPHLEREFHAVIRDFGQTISAIYTEGVQ
jgi:hypothetical protein